MRRTTKTMTARKAGIEREELVNIVASFNMKPVEQYKRYTIKQLTAEYDRIAEGE